MARSFAKAFHLEKVIVNMAGYLTAEAVSQDSFNVAMADLMSSLSAIPTG
jgi:hypothetical protein